VNQLRYVIPALRATFVIGVMLALCSPPAYMVAGCLVACVTAVASWLFVRRNFPPPFRPDPLRPLVTWNHPDRNADDEIVSPTAEKLVVEVYERQNNQSNIIEF